MELFREIFICFFFAKKKQIQNFLIVYFKGKIKSTKVLFLYRFRWIVPLGQEASLLLYPIFIPFALKVYQEWNGAIQQYFYYVKLTVPTSQIKVGWQNPRYVKKNP